MNITFHFELNSYVRKDGTRNVMVRITQNKKPKRESTSIYVLERDWNAEKEEVRRSDVQHSQKNAVLRAKRIELEQAYLKTTVAGRVATPTQLLKKVKRQMLGDSFFSFAYAHIADLRSAASRASQTSVVQKLQDFLKGADLRFGEIDIRLLNQYRRHLVGRGNGANTIHSNFSKLRGIYNEAARTGHFHPEHGNPFDLVQVRKTKSKRVKLTKEQIEEFYRHPVREGINNFHARNVFLFSFYCHGVRFADVIQLTWGQIRSGRYEYVASKTDKIRSIGLHKRVVEILNMYRLPGQKEGDYVFPYLKGYVRSRYTDDEWLVITKRVNALVNKGLYKIADQVGLPRFSIHVARHSFADIARKETGDVYAVSEALDHSSVSVTENYFAAAKQEENDAFARKVFGEEE